MALYFLVRHKLLVKCPLKNLACITTFKRELDYKKCYRILGISEESDQEQIRCAYLELVKRFHPDSGTEEANVEKFHEIDHAFRTLINKKSKERWDVPDVQVEEQDIKHTAPQHRQYLSFDGIGVGNPFQRQKQYTKVRAMQAAENVYQHRVAKVTADDKSLMDKAPLKHKIKTKYGFDRLVEDLIQESMSKGEFTNLSGVGKPLPSHQNRNPYVDFVTHKLNEVLIDNGFTPEWILLQKEIRVEAHKFREDLLMERQYFGPFPLSVDENIDWSEVVYKYNKTVENINKKIAKYNLVVPILDKQLLQININNEAQRALITGKSNEDTGFKRNHQRSKRKKEEDERYEPATINLFSFIDSFFRGK